MRDMPVILSISMLISGRDEMKKSLDSLHYFTEVFPCEVILVDTGCNPEQRALALKYADKIVDFEWCNDFAAARNAGLEEAGGEWFMYLDDDEWFDNPQQIVDFFVSGEYKNYKSATYTVRNYRDAEGTMYADTYASRMVKRLPETRFVGKIHEYLEPYERPRREFTDFVHHYGYAFKGEEDRQEHSARNIKPLLEQRKDNPGDPRWMCQLAQEYFILREYEEVIRICKEGLEEWNRFNRDFQYVPAHVGGIYVYLMIAMEVLERYEEEEKWLKKAFADPNMQLEIMAPTRAFFCMLGAKLYENLKDYRQSAYYLRRYIDYAKCLEGNRAILETGAALIVTSVFHKTLMYSAVLNCMEAAIRTQDHALAEEAFYMLDWQNEELLNQNEWEKKMVDAFCCTAYHPVWVKLLQTLVSRPGGMREMLAVFLEIEGEYRQQGETIGKEKLSRLRRLVSELDYEHGYVQCARILHEEAHENTGKIAALFEELFEKYQNEILMVGTEVWNVAERHDISLKSALLKIDYRSWKRMLEQWCRTANLWEIRQWEARLSEWRGLPHFDLSAVKCLEASLRRYKEACPEPEKLEETLWRYADGVLAFYTPYYRDFVFREEWEILPDEAQLAIELKNLQRYRGEGNDLKALESARKCLGVCTGVEEAVEAYAKMLRDDVQKRDREADEAQTELRHLIASLKKAARMQLEAGQYQAAKDILIQVRQCAPEDADVRNMLAQAEENLKDS